MRKDRGKLRECELFGARAGTNAAGCECSVDAVIGSDGAEVVPQGLSFLREAQLNEFKKTPGICGEIAEIGALAGERHLHESRSDSRRWVECSRRNPEQDFGLRIKLAGRREITVGARTGGSGDSLCDFPLDNNVNG